MFKLIGIVFVIWALFHFGIAQLFALFLSNILFFIATL